ncbi:Protein 21.1 [Giardia lamblia P15]|uniref:Protein 21.1 n=1 Tax=Giardia intestinalis (strain P15) TaxID=658858 RepID=E1EXY5_GIAIA|nr:Protein 21.1 [Giardia lamblia P15]
MHGRIKQYEIYDDVSPLFDAVRNNDAEMVQKTLNYAGIYDSMKMTALMHAARHNYLDIVKILEPLEGHLVGSYGEAALMHAAECGALEVAQYLIPLQGHIEPTDLLGNSLVNAMRAGEIQCAELFYDNEKNKVKVTPLMWAAFVGDISMVQEEIALKNNLGKRAHGGYTALMFAACSNQAQVIELLLPYEAELRDNYEETALMHAAQNSSVDAARILVEKELGLSTKIGGTALYAAAGEGCLEIVKMTMEKEHSIFYNGFSPLYIAANSGHLDCVKALVQYIDKFKSSSDTGLGGAASGGHVDIVEFLIPYEVKATMGNGGTTALMYAAQNNKIQCVRMLKEYELGLVNDSGFSALSLAAATGSSKLVSLLLDELPLLPKEAASPLEECLFSNKFEVVKLLLPREKHRVGASDLMVYACTGKRDKMTRVRSIMMQRQDSGGRTALMYAVMSKQLDCAKALLAESRVTDNEGRSALMYAVLLKPDECLPFVKLLIGLTGIQDENGETALMKAAGNNNYMAVRELAPYEKRMIDTSGDTALIIASRGDAYKCVKYLLDEIDIVDECGSTALENAKDYGGYNVYRMLSTGARSYP